MLVALLPFATRIELQAGTYDGSMKILLGMNADRCIIGPVQVQRLQGV